MRSFALMEIDDYVIDTLMRDLVGHDRSPSAFLTYLFLYRQCVEEARELSLAEIARGTGLSKRGVQSAIGRLEARQLLTVSRESVTSMGSYTVHRPWLSRSRTKRPSP